MHRGADVPSAHPRQSPEELRMEQLHDFDVSMRPR